MREEKELSNPRQFAERRILIFRILTFLSLLLTAILSATFGYILFTNSEDKFYRDQYNSFVKAAYRGISQNVESRVAVGKSVAANYGGYCPNLSSWPNCWLPYVTFQGLIEPYQETLQMVLTGMYPLVSIDQVESFENFSYGVYRKEGYPPSVGTASGTYGIFSRDLINGGFYHDTTDATSQSPYKVLVPMFQMKKNYFPMALFNAHSASSQTLPIDQLITCHQSSPKLCDSSVTDFVDIEETGEPVPTTGVYIAISPLRDSSKIVGLVSYYIRWLDILSDKLSVLENTDLVIDTGATTKTFRFKPSGVRMVGNGDFHDPKFDDLRITLELSISGSTMSLYNYTLSFYPTQDFYDEYHTNTPFYVCLFALLVVLVTSLSYLIYDFFAKRESHEQTRILEAKQSYVRFISHVSLVS
jgi:hypothetical protein